MNTLTNNAAEHLIINSCTDLITC